MRQVVINLPDGSYECRECDRKDAEIERLRGAEMSDSIKGVFAPRVKRKRLDLLCASCAEKDAEIERLKKDNGHLVLVASSEKIRAEAAEAKVMRVEELRWRYLRLAGGGHGQTLGMDGTRERQFAEDIRAALDE